MAKADRSARVELRIELADIAAQLEGLAERLTAAQKSVSRLVRDTEHRVRDAVRQDHSERSRRGMETARARGIRLGRKPKLTPQQERMIFKMVTKEGATRITVAEKYGVHPVTIGRLVKRLLAQ